DEIGGAGLSAVSNGLLWPTSVRVVTRVFGKGTEQYGQVVPFDRSRMVSAGRASRHPGHTVRLMGLPRRPQSSGESGRRRPSERAGRRPAFVLGKACSAFWSTA